MSLYDLVITAIVSISGFLGITLITERKQSPFRQEFLGISLLIVGLTFAYVVFNSTGILLKFPFLIRLLSPFMYLVGPLFYFYFLTAYREDAGLRWKDAFHALPALLHFVELLPFYLLDAETKRSLAFSIQSDINVLFRQGGGWIPITYHYAFRVFLLFVYAGLIFQKLWQERLRCPSSTIAKALSNVAYFYTGLVLVLSLIYLMGLGYFPPTLEKYGNLFFVNVLALLLLAGFGLLSIRQMRAPKEVPVSEENNFTGSPKPTVPDLPSHSFSEEEIKELGRRIDAFFDSGSYKNPKLRVKDLAGHLKITERELNPVIQEYFGMKFNDLLKQYRVEEAKRLIEQDTQGIWTMDGLGLEAGFSSRSSFFMVFKEKTGMTPKQYQDKCR